MSGLRVTARGNPFEKFIPARYLVAILGGMGMAIIYGLKVNLSVGIVSMVNQTAVGSKQPGSNSSSGGGKDGAEDGPFVWSTTLQGTILSAYFWGYIVAQMPGGRISETFSAKWVMFFSVAINVVCTLFSPIAATIHPAFLIVLRVGEGIGGGVTFPAMHVLLAHWAPPFERSIMSSICYAGTALGTVMSMLLSGVTAGGIGWAMIFYTQGGAACIWLVLWWFLIADSPEKQKIISEEEREYIMKSLQGGRPEEKIKVPWKSVFKSMPFYAIMVAHICSNWGWYMVLMELPNFMKTALKFKISENALLTALPFFCMWIFSMLLSKTLDRFILKEKITTTIARKLSTAIASILPLICFVGLCFVNSNQRMLAVVLMTLAVTFSAGMFCGFLSNHIDIAPNFAGTLMAITNTLATIPGIVVPIFVGKLTEKDASLSTWRIIFMVTIVLYIVEAVVYTLFGSGKEQSWNQGEEAQAGVPSP